MYRTWHARHWEQSEGESDSLPQSVFNAFFLIIFVYSNWIEGSAPLSKLMFITIYAHIVSYFHLPFCSEQVIALTYWLLEAGYHRNTWSVLCSVFFVLRLWGRCIRLRGQYSCCPVISLHGHAHHADGHKGHVVYKSSTTTTSGTPLPAC